MILAVLALVKAGRLLAPALRAHDLRPRGVVDGATYTDVNAAAAGASTCCCFISLLAAVLFICNIWRRGWVLPVIAVGLWAFVAVVAGTIYPAFIQRFRVRAGRVRAGGALHRAQHRGHPQAPSASTDVGPEVPYQVDRSTADVGRLETNPDDHPATCACSTRRSSPPTLPAASRACAASTGSTTSTSTATTVGRRRCAAGRAGAAASSTPADLPQRRRGRAATSPTPTATAWRWPRPARSSADGQPDYLRTSTCRSRSPDPDLQIAPSSTSARTSPSYAVVNTGRDEVAYPPPAREQPQRGTRARAGCSSTRRCGGPPSPSASASATCFGSNLITNQTAASSTTATSATASRSSPRSCTFDADPYPVVRRRPDRLDHRRLHHHRPLPVRPAGRHRPAARPAAACSTRFNYVRNSVKAVVDAYDGTVTFYVVDDERPDHPGLRRRPSPSCSSSIDEMPAGAARPLPLPGGPVPGADQHVRPATTSPTRRASTSRRTRGTSRRTRRRRRTAPRRRPRRRPRAFPSGPVRPASRRTTRSRSSPGPRRPSSCSCARSRRSPSRTRGVSSPRS